MACGCNLERPKQKQRLSPACICDERFNKDLPKQHICNKRPDPDQPRADEMSMFGCCCKCPPPPPAEEPEPPPKCCPYLVCPCPEPCRLRDEQECEDKPKCCCHLDCQKSPTGFNVTCKSCCKNCPVEIYCPVPKSCLPRCTSNCPQRYPHHPWCIIDATNFHAI